MKVDVNGPTKPRIKFDKEVNIAHVPLRIKPIRYTKFKIIKNMQNLMFLERNFEFFQTSQYRFSKPLNQRVSTLL